MAVLRRAERVCAGCQKGVGHPHDKHCVHYNVRRPFVLHGQTVLKIGPWT